MAKQKYYVVWQGTKIGVFDNWEDCSKQIKGFTDAKFKSFDSKTIAEKAFRDGYQQHLTNNKVPNSNTSAKQKKATEVHWNALCVDAACSGNPGDMEYRGVLANTGKEVFRQGPFREGTNNVGEFLQRNVVGGEKKSEHKVRSNRSKQTDIRVITTRRKLAANEQVQQQNSEMGNGRLGRNSCRFW